ncbi:O-Antigen ligase [Caloramator quimbayensis]|uniref:O-Antigen ligase n=1 Tax=Caloramator quimbayensis TaxID=1147123 RepID=A0A1T4WH98_9CLOT|nr:O-antigen ligase family protein [Caloramator quimbayensis]SKA76662.1 O-Antigen ligase [Caloramator quimbayensis]
MGKNNKKSRNNVKENIIFIIPICLILMIVPLIVRLKIVELNSDVAFFWTGSTNFDFFSYNKAKVFIFLVIAAVIINLFNKGFKLKSNKLLYIFSFTYILSVVISALLSKNKSVSLFGFPDRYEGVFALISYIIIMLLTYNLINSYKTIDSFLKCLYISAIIIGIIGLFQYFNMDFFNTQLGKRLIVPLSNSNLLEGLKFTLGERAVYGTLYHTNYVGSFMAILFPLTLSLAILHHNKYLKILFSLLSVLFLFNAITCHSRAGILGIIFSFVLLIILFRSYIIKHYRLFSIILVSSVILVIGANKVWNNYLFSKIGTLFSDAKNLVSNEQTKDNTLLKDISLDGKRLKINYNDAVLNFEIKNNTIFIYDDKNNELKYDMDFSNGKITIKDERYKDKDILFGLFDNKPLIQLQISTAKLYFIYDNDKFKILRNKGQYYEISKIEKLGFEGKENLGSARAYIWSRTFPLIKKSPVFGYGPDNFAMYFPQNDVVGKLNVYGDPYIIVDKAHNMYLQTLVNTGIISLISLIGIFLIYLIQSFKIYMKSKFETNYEIIGISVFLGICAYFIAALFNDSVVSVAPVFWILLGIGFGVNERVNN